MRKNFIDDYLVEHNSFTYLELEAKASKRYLPILKEQDFEHAKDIGAAFYVRSKYDIYLVANAVTIFYAIEKLDQGLSVTSIALDLWYSTPSSFIVAFRKILGKSPLEYMTG